MFVCQQKYCVNCIKPVFTNGKFSFGQCKISRHIVLVSDADDTKLYSVQPLYCYQYKPRKRKIKY